MNWLSLAEESRHLDLSPKRYLQSYADIGYELGIGAKGAYPGHAHTYYWDVMFCPEGLTCRDASSSEIGGLLLIVPPRTYFEAEFYGVFAFLKFTDFGGAFKIPDKVELRQAQGSPQVHVQDCSTRLNWCRRPGEPIKWIDLHLAVPDLTIRPSGCPPITIRA